MDAIKVLWKEVQMMDATKGASVDKPRPSGSLGSKISSRSSEHSIAKLMETLEATASPTKVGAGNNNGSSIKHSQTEESLRLPSPAAVASSSSNVEATTINRLNETCSSLQTQVEQLQSSLDGVLRFMSSLEASSGPTSLPPQMMMMSASGNLGEQKMFTSLDPAQLASSCDSLVQVRDTLDDSRFTRVLLVLEIKGLKCFPLWSACCRTG